jgi:LysM repeat protein
VFARILTFVAIVVFLWAVVARDTGASGREQRLVVRPADTLWSIASTHFAGDPREGVYRIRERNGLTSSTIRPGQVLLVPAG